MPQRGGAQGLGGGAEALRKLRKEIIPPSPKRLTDPMAGADAWGIVLRKAEHALLFVRAAPVMLLAALVALILLRKRKSDCQKTSLKTCVTEQRGVCAGGGQKAHRAFNQTGF